MFYFRDSSGNEVDLIVKKETGPLAIEIKSSKRISKDMLSGLKYWKKYQPKSSAILLYVAFKSIRIVYMPFAVCNLSETTCPSSSVMTRSAKAAYSGSWVTITIV